MEALTLLTAALARLEVGSLGVAAFGGPTATRMLHTLGEPWSDASAAAVLGQLQFDQDNTLRDTPLLDVLCMARRMFAAERRQVSGHQGVALPSQLLLIVADGHFHERALLQRAVRETAGNADGDAPLVVFILLDSAPDSVLSLQQVSFHDGVPTFRRYLEGFPFPYYIVLRHIQHLPHLLADLLRQWLQLYSM
jgi:midasin